MKDFWTKHRSLIINIAVFLFLGSGLVQERWKNIQMEGPDLIEIAFAIDNFVMLFLILFRQDHRAIETNIFPQLIALMAFFSGIFLVRTPLADASFPTAAKWVLFAGIVFGIMTLLNLGKSFGILISLREVKSRGIYGVVRHPMYLSDILVRVGYILKNSCTQNVILFGASILCYVYRAILEEKFLGQFPEYQEYMKRVRYRFIPGIF